MAMTIDDIDLADIYEFMERGDVKNAPQHIVDYLHLLDKIRGMRLRIDQFGSKDIIVKELMLTENLSRYKAGKIYDEAIEYFYSDTTISKTAWRNVYADMMDKMINVAAQLVRDIQGAEKVAKMAKEAAVLRGVDLPDKEEMPKDLDKRPFVVYSTDAEMLGLPKANRTRLAQMIDALPDLSEKERIRIKSEAQILPIKVFLDEQEDPRKS